MKYRKLGSSDIQVSEIGLGCWTLGGLNWVNGVPNGWANVDEDEAIRAVHYALDQGVNHFDNADVYGNGRAERMLAKALGDRSKDVVIATKVGHFPGTATHAYEPQHIRHQLEQSLINLKRDYVDIYYFHHGDFGENDYYLDDAVEMVYRLKEEGKIRLIGQSAYSNKDFLRLVPKLKPDVLQSWAHALDDHFIADGTPVRKLLEERKMSFMAFSPLAQGLLLNKYSTKNLPTFENGDHRRNSDRFTKENLEKLEPKMEKIVARFGAEIKELSRFALQYLLSYPVVGSVIPGFRNQKQVKANLWGAGMPLTTEDVKFIQNVFKS
ncbi:MAG: aldo/keto reductase [Candidatus Marinimicrobia bacterium]|nr:aldo/keto reductase [Candidatus Neomarinimicrobiota bacterium]